jgi:hypothetical protein
MSEETEVKIEEVVARSQEEAQKLTETIDQWNRQRGYKPLLHSRQRGGGHDGPVLSLKLAKLRRQPTKPMPDSA